MNPDLQQKIRRYQESKKMKKNFDDTVEEKRKKLRQLTAQVYDENYNINESKIQKNMNEKSKAQRSNHSADGFMEYKHQRFIQTSKQLMDLKLKLTEITHQCQDMKTEIFFEEKKLNQMRQYIHRQQQEEQQLLTKKAAKLQQQKNEKIKMYQDRVTKNVEHVEQLLKEKQEQNQRKLKFVEKKKKFEQLKLKTKEKYEEQLKANKQKWAQQEKLKKEGWQKAKYQEIQSRTLRNLEPHIQKIVQQSKDQINKIRDNYQGLITEFKKAADQEFQKSVKAFRQAQAVQLEQERNIIIQQNNKKLKEQAQQLQKQFEQERVKAKNDYNEQIKALEHNRRVQSEEYMRKNRYFYAQNLQQLRRIRDQYETKISQLDGVLMKQVDQRQALLAQRNRIKIQQLKQSSRIKLKKRMQQYDKKIKSQIQANIEKLSEEIAVENAAYERKIAKATEQRVKIEKQNAEVEIKQIKKSIVAIENKIEKLKKEREVVKQEREEKEMTYLQTKNQNQYLNKKLLEINAQVEELKVSESSIQGRKHDRKQQVERMWDRQIESIRASLQSVEFQFKNQMQVMKQKQKTLIKQTQQAIKQIQKQSDKIIKQKQIQQESLLVKIQHEQKNIQNLKMVIKKQIEMMKNYNIQ